MTESQRENNCSSVSQRFTIRAKGTRKRWIKNENYFEEKKNAPNIKAHLFHLEFLFSLFYQFCFSQISSLRSNVFSQTNNAKRLAIKYSNQEQQPQSNETEGATNCEDTPIGICNFVDRAPSLVRSKGQSVALRGIHFRKQNRTTTGFIGRSRRATTPRPMCGATLIRGIVGECPSVASLHNV